MSLIELENLTFSYDGSCRQVFENLSLQLDSTWRLGLIGRNGRGKTTLLRLLAGEIMPDQGSLSVPAEGLMFPFSIPDLSMTAEDLGWTLTEDFQPWRLGRELRLLGLPEELSQRPLAAMSGGEQTKVQLALLFGMEGQLLLIDEPTNHLDAQGRARVGEYLASKNGFILVSHDRDFLDRSVDHILCLGRGGAELLRGNYSLWQTENQRRNDRELQRNQELKREISRLTQAARQGAQWSELVEKSKKGANAKGASGLRPDRGYIGHQAAKMMRRAKNIQRRRGEAIEEKQGLLKNVETAPPLDIHPLPCPWPRVVSCRQISVSRGDREILSELSLEILPGERVALTGSNGCGKTTLLRLLAREESPCNGALLLPQGLKISVVPQDCTLPTDDLESFIQLRQLDGSLFRTILRKLGFEREQFEMKLSSWSAGQKKKALLAASLCTPAHLYLWDEPLNYVDLDSRLQLEELILRCRPTMVLVEHDSAFRRKVSTRTISLEANQQTAAR